MSPLGWLAVAGAALVMIVLIVLLRAVAILGQAVDGLTAQVAQLRDHTVPALHEVRRALRTVEGQAARADALLDVATSITSSADSASKFAHRVVTNPFIKVIAFLAGTRRAAAKLRGGD